MIKVQYKDFVFELENVKQLKDFFESTQDEEVEVREKVMPKGLLPEVKVSMKVKRVKLADRKHKYAKRSVWTPAEIRHILDHLDSQGPKAIARSAFLNRHSLVASKQMVWRVQTNWKNAKSKLHPDLQAMVDEYHAKRAKPSSRFVPIGEYANRA